MKEFVSLVIVLLIYGLISIVAYKLLIRINSRILRVGGLLLYYSLTYGLFEFINFINRTLRENNIVIDFGHANTALVLLFFVCCLIALVNSFFILKK